MQSMERFKTVDVSVIDQKENNPSLAKDEKDRNAQDGNATVNYVPHAGTHLIKLMHLSMLSCWGVGGEAGHRRGI